MSAEFKCPLTAFALPLSCPFFLCDVGTERNPESSRLQPMRNLPILTPLRDLGSFAYRNAISPPARCLWCRNAWLPQKRRKTCLFVNLVSQLSCVLLVRGTYTVDYHRAKDCCCYALAVFGVFGAAHHGVVAAGEHAANGAEDYDGEDGDDDAIGGVSMPLSFSCFLRPLELFFRVGVPCPCIEGGDDGLHGCWCWRGAALSVGALGRGLRGRGRVEGRGVAARWRANDVVNVLRRSMEVRRRWWMGSGVCWWMM